MSAMRISVTDAMEQLEELVRLAEAGEEIVLTRHGREVVRLVPARRTPSAEEKAAILDEIRVAALKTATPGPCAARSQDFLYDEFGLPI
jgi:prevent-host-death family protein